LTDFPWGDDDGAASQKGIGMTNFLKERGGALSAGIQGRRKGVAPGDIHEESIG